MYSLKLAIMLSNVYYHVNYRLVYVVCGKCISTLCYKKIHLNGKF